MIVISTGCPAGIGPEISLLAAAKCKSSCLLVGDWQTLCAAAELAGVARERLIRFAGEQPSRGRIAVVQSGPALTRADRKGGKPTKQSGVAQLAYIEDAFRLVKSHQGSALVTAPVSKAVIAHCGLARAKHFLGHTEWLESMDGR